MALTTKEIDILEGLYSMGTIYTPPLHIASISKASLSKVNNSLKKFKRNKWIEFKDTKKGKEVRITKLGREKFIAWEKAEAKKSPKTFYADLSLGVATIDYIYMNSAFMGGWRYTARRGSGSKEWRKAEDVIKKAKETNMKIYISGMERDWKDYPEVKPENIKIVLNIKDRIPLSVATIEKMYNRYKKK